MRLNNKGKRNSVMTKFVIKTRRRSGSVVTTCLTPFRGVDCCNDRHRVRKDSKSEKN